MSPKWLVFCCAQFGLWRGARREHPPKWGCDRRATKPQAKLGATRRAAVLFAPGFVARSLQIHFGICSSLAPRLERKALAAKHQPFRRHNTRLASKIGVGRLVPNILSAKEGIVRTSRPRPSSDACLNRPYHNWFEQSSCQLTGFHYDASPVRNS